MNPMKNILLSIAIMSTTFSPSMIGKMSKEDAKKMERRLMATGAVVGSITEFAAVWNYAKHSPSTSKARGPLKVLISTIAGVGGLCVGAFAGEAASDAIAERLMRDDASTPELLEPHDADHAGKTEELIIEKS